MEKHERIIATLVLKVKANNGGEAANALHTLKKLCIKHNLDIDEVMTGKKLEQRFYKITPSTKEIVAQTILRYGQTREIYNTRGGKHYGVELDEATHLRTATKAV